MNPDPYGQPLPYYGGVPNAALLAQLYRRPAPNLWPFGQHAGSVANDLPRQTPQQRKQNTPHGLSVLGMRMLYPQQ